MLKKVLTNILNLPKTIVGFFKGLFLELKFVTWIKGSDVLRYTIFLMLFLIFGSITILLIDQVFLLIRGLLIPA